MLVEQTMLQMMVAMVMTCLIPAVTYAVQVDFPKVPHRHHKIRSSLTHDESDVDPHPSRIIDDAFDNAHIIPFNDKTRAPSTSGLDSQLKHGLVERRRRSQHNQHWNQKNDKNNHDKGRTLKSLRTENKYEHKLLKDHGNFSVKN
ncbi:uncharacterized protein LOC115920408 [Strongylocentrotus purpuratus]|uniref:Secreted protein n=1 Tax=Strongylocentrotus purpuratus TaxID=7668 RepID=A0A7M7N6S3_STRPU|nr:uncharacterized protein LOC115920408 [Strongylocentrotus purpuratus]